MRKKVFKMPEARLMQQRTFYWRYKKRLFSGGGGGEGYGRVDFKDINDS